MPPRLKFGVESVEALLSSLEKAAEKQKKTVGGGMVKRRAAENAVCKESEASRDCLNRNMSDKNLLAEVFGGHGCEKFHRYRKVLDELEFSEMYADDNRQTDLRKVLDAIEEILKERGMFNPSSVGAIPPTGFKYQGVKSRYAPGEAVSLFPECDAYDCDFEIVEGTIPRGLRFDKTTGELKGTLAPGVELPEKSLKVKAANSKGEETFEITFSVGPPPPENLSYTTPEFIYVYDDVFWEPTVEGGKPKTWSISPSLPEGLSVDNVGIIYGAPEKDMEATPFTVTAENTIGSCTAGLKFEVRVAPPKSVDYDTVGEFPVGGVIYSMPTVAFVKSETKKKGFRDLVRQKVLHKAVARTQIPDLEYSIEPPLPEGVSIGAKTGIIMGKAAQPMDEVVYTVTAKNKGGACDTKVPIAIVFKPPTNLTYPVVADSFFTDQPITTLEPSIEGHVDNWAIEPALPEGLYLDPDDGTISGTPVEGAPKGVYTITAKNSAGEATFPIEFEVEHSAPRELGFFDGNLSSGDGGDVKADTGAVPDSGTVYPLLRPMEINPRVAGKVDEYSISPALPEGISLDPLTGKISGTPTVEVDETTYMVTAKNANGSTESPLVFAVKETPPSDLSYPSIDDVYTHGEDVLLQPEIVGGANSWVVEPALPAGLQIDPSTGVISGAPTETAPEQDYTVTASNKEGGTSTVLTFGVTAPPPSGLSYTCNPEYNAGMPVSIQPTVEVAICATYTIEPALPEGLEIDPKTGDISGAAKEPVDEITYTVTSTNIGGSITAQLAFAIIQGLNPETGVDEAIARLIEEMTCVDDLGDAPPGGTQLDWMIWMVHRAYLNDPRLTELNFNGLTMPAPHLERRIAPKLMKALATNTHLTNLQLANSNLQRPQGHEMAAALKSNTAIQILNIESNNLDSECIREMIEGVTENTDSSITEWRMTNQKHMGTYFGRPVEEAMCTMVKKNTNVVKLGFACQDRNWKNEIDKAMIKNCDLARRRRKRTIIEEVTEEAAAVEKPLGGIMVVWVPEDGSWEVFDNENQNMNVVRNYVAEHKSLPTNQQLQSAAKANGISLKYNEVAPLIKDFRTKLLNTSTTQKIELTDTYGKLVIGTLRSWTEKNNKWSLDFWPTPNEHNNFTAAKAPKFGVSAEVASWLKPE